MRACIRQPSRVLLATCAIRPPAAQSVLGVTLKGHMTDHAIVQCQAGAADRPPTDEPRYQRSLKRAVPEDHRKEILGEQGSRLASEGKLPVQVV